LLAAPARAASWSDACAGDSAATVFFTAEGALVRAPFDLATRETLWTPPGGERLVRVRVSPDGRQVAWLSRIEGRDSTTLWMAGDSSAARPLARYLPLRPGLYGVLHYEAPVPGTQDPDIRGGRLVQPGVRDRGLDAFAFAWTPDSRAIVLAHASGLSAVATDGSAFAVSGTLAAAIEPLDPAPFYLVRAIVARGQAPPTAADEALGEQVTPMPSGPAPARGGRAELRSELLYPLPHRWRVYAASDFDPDARRAASDVTAWFVSGGRLRAVRADDPRARVVADVGGRALWLGVDPARREVLWVSERGLFARGEEAGAAHALARPPGTIHAAFASRDGAVVGVVADSLLVWDVAAAQGQSVALGGLDPVALFRAPGGALFALAGARGRPASLARVDLDAHTLRPIDTPVVGNADVAQSPGGALLLLYAPGQLPSARLHVYDMAQQRWSEVDNPGLAGWEPLTPR
ncbi:MAG TPA: hypothetical protein VFK69_11695, partial [Candidatus Eisenbacteria bacterium]|nr:hypothetical protein [Candidatus Eisenbacteria bacterium]